MCFEALIRNFPFDEVEQSWTSRDTILYALGLGYGHDPLDEHQLPFIYEDAVGFRAVPTMAAILAGPGFWVRDPRSGIQWQKILHGEQSIQLYRPLPTAGRVRARTHVVDVLDKGADKGALIYLQRDLHDSASNEKLATLGMSIFARGNGGFGGRSRGPDALHRLPDRAFDTVCDIPTSPQSALIYRLSGDLNPLHIDPEIARQAGFKSPILHGLCTLGVAGHAVLRTYCNLDTSRFVSLSLRFSRPTYPGETIRTYMWRDGDIVSFCCQAVEREVTVLDHGRVEIC